MRGFRQWQWHLDEMYVRLNGEMHYLWRAVDQEGEVLESYVTKSRDKAAALAFMKKALRRHRSPATIITDGLRSHKAAMSELGNADKQVICPLLSGPKSMLFWVMKEIGNGLEEAQAGGDYWQAA